MSIDSITIKKTMNEDLENIEVTKETFIRKRPMDEKGFNQWTRTYDDSVSISQKNNSYPFAGYSKILDSIYEKIKGKSVKTILDIGFGTGIFTSRLYKDGYNIYGVDFSCEMKKAAQEKMPDASI